MIGWHDNPLFHHQISTCIVNVKFQAVNMFLNLQFYGFKCIIFRDFLLNGLKSQAEFTFLCYKAYDREYNCAYEYKEVRQGELAT